MTRDVARAALYRGSINLWVEDETTRAYLSELWNDPDIAYFIGGGNEGVKAIVKDAEEAGFRNVFAVIDRDFRESNTANWLAPGKTFRTFILPVHEIENYLLDASALAACRFNNIHRTEADIEGFMSTHAGKLCWWAACREVVAELKHRFRDGFLPDPKSPPVDTEAEAYRHICDSDWFKRLATEFGRSTEAHVRQQLADAHARSTERLSDGTWRTEFAGKEILRDAGSRFFDRTRFPSYTARGAEFDTDLAKEVASWQVKNQKIPLELSNLRKALRQRIQAPRTA